MSMVGACSADRGEDALRRPNNVEVAADGTLLVADFLHSRIVRFDDQGRCLATYARQGFGRGEVYRVWGLSATPDGGFAVLDHGLEEEGSEVAATHQVKVFDRSGHQTDAFSVTPPDGEGAGWPEGLAQVPEGWVVTDQERDAMLFFAPDGTFLRSVVEVVGGPPLSSPGNVGWAGGSLWLTEYEDHRVRRLGPTGQQELMVGVEGTGPGEFLFPEAIAASDEGWFVVGDMGNFRVQRFDLQGRHLGTIVPEPARSGVQVQVYDVAVGADGTIYVADSTGNRILAYRPDGTLVRTLAQTDC